MTTTESSLQVWYCSRCRKSCKIWPPNREPACQCENPVRGLRPTRITLVTEPKRRPLQALTAEEGRLRSLARKGQRVRVTYEAEVVQAWTRADSDGVKHVQFMVATADGRRHHVDPQLPGVHVEAVDPAP